MLFSKSEQRADVVEVFAHIFNLHGRIPHLLPQNQQIKILVSIVTNLCTYLLKNTLKSHKILSPRHVSDHTRIHPQEAIIRSWQFSYAATVPTIWTCSMNL